MYIMFSACAMFLTTVSVVDSSQDARDEELHPTTSFADAEYTTDESSTAVVYEGPSQPMDRYSAIIFCVMLQLHYETLAEKLLFSYVFISQDMIASVHKRSMHT